MLKSDADGATKIALINDFDKVLSLDLVKKADALIEAEKAAESDVPAEIQALVDQRREARKAKNFALADELRDKIAELGWVVEETRQGTKIYKK